MGQNDRALRERAAASVEIWLVYCTVENVSPCTGARNDTQTGVVVMSQAERVEVLVLGSGAGGKLLAWEMAQAGHRTAVVERKWIGGSCPNINCLPSKNEVKSAEVADVVHHAGVFGTAATGVRTDMDKVLARKREMVDGLVAMHLERYRASGAELILGQARFVGAKTIEVTLNDGGTRLLRGDRVFLNLGTRPFVPPIPGLAEAALTNIELLELDRLPERLVVLGGGYVGLEFAQAYRRFGSRVTVVERGSHVLTREDPDVADAVQRLFVDEEIELLLSTETLRVDGRRGALSVVVRTSGGEERAIAATDILSATGRTPNTRGIGLDIAGVDLDARGYIAVNERLETSAPDVWAIGECAGSPQFTHVSVDDFRIIRDNLDGGSRTTRGRLVPFCVFTDPPLARVGLNELEANRQGVKARIATLPVREVLRTRTTGETRGFMKALVDPQRDDILGFTMFGAEAGEVMAVVQTAMLAGLPFTRLRDAVLTHPTMAEGLGDLFGRVGK
jgi:pyruvate/2-oxoglutarate dehydrogenase complex dihydrolipoamide dehydrogenase (E3) component